MNTAVGDEVLLKQIVRQLKLLNFWIAAFGTLVLVALVITGIILYKLVTFANESVQGLNNVQQQAKDSLDIKSKLCGSDAKAVLPANLDLCN